MSADQAESSSKSLALTPPEPVAVVQAQQADELVPLSGEDVARLDAQVGEFVGEVLSLDVKGPDFQERVTRIVKLGNDEIAVRAISSHRVSCWVSSPSATRSRRIFRVSNRRNLI